MILFVIQRPPSCSILQTHPSSSPFPLIFSVTFKLRGLLFQAKCIFLVFPSPGHIRIFCVAFRIYCKDFYIMKSNGLNDHCHETMILLQAIYFCTYRTFLCNITEIRTIANERLYFLLKGALLSQTRPCAFSVCLPLVFGSSDDGKCYKPKGLRFMEPLYDSDCICSTFTVHWRMLPFIFRFSYLLPLTSVSISTSHAHG